jgi:UDP-N-acetylmuramoylalanine--D-glutamate ligase
MPVPGGLTSWFAEWKDLKVLVVGLGVTGFSVADTLWELGSDVLVVTRDATPEHLAMLNALGVRYALTPTEDDAVAAAAEFTPDLVVVSPGVNPRHPLIAWANDQMVPIWGDIELAWRVRDKVAAAEWILITGTNGKTTTTQLTAHALRTAGFRALAVGNIGIPVLDAVREPAGFDFLVVELSSFQLHWLPLVGEGALQPLSSAVLNVADDHIDWHGSMDAYRTAKGVVYANTKSVVLYSTVDPVTEALVRDANVAEGCEAIGFGFKTPDTGELGTVDGILVDRAFTADRRNTAQEIVTIDHLAELGFASPHMILNILAASGLAIAAGSNAASVAESLESFEVDHHRCETITEHDGVRWVDDSKATNAHAANSSLRTFPSLVWIVGGLFKGVSIDELVQAHASRLKAVVVIGEDRTEPLRALSEWAPSVPVVEVTDGDIMNTAVREAARLASAGDTVLLAPAAASMDQFVDYVDRGRQFADAVRAHTGMTDG